MNGKITLEVVSTGVACSVQIHNASLSDRLTLVEALATGLSLDASDIIVLAMAMADKGDALEREDIVSFDSEDDLARFLKGGH